MILIDGPMPKRCAECPCFDDTMYGKCRVKDVWLGAKDGAWFTEQRPSWCPLIEIAKCKDCKHVEDRIKSDRIKSDRILL